MKLLIRLCMVFTLCAALSFAQRGRGGGGGGGGRGGGSAMSGTSTERSLLLLLTAMLDLSDSQRQQLTSVFDAAVKTAAPVATQIESNKQALFEAAKSGKSDDQIKTIADQQASLSSQLVTLQAQTLSKMWALLNSDQQAKVDTLMYAHIGDLLSNAR